MSLVRRLLTQSDVEQRFRITDLRAQVVRVVVLGKGKKVGWYKGIWGWTVGGLSSGADLVLSEPLDGVDLGIFPASNHLILWGRVADGAEVPEIAFDYDDGLVRWEKSAAERRNEIFFRFDGRPLQIGHHLIEMLYDDEDG